MGNVFPSLGRVPNQHTVPEKMARYRVKREKWKQQGGRRETLRREQPRPASQCSTDSWTLDPRRARQNRQLPVKRLHSEDGCDDKSSWESSENEESVEAIKEKFADRRARELQHARAQLKRRTSSFELDAPPASRTTARGAAATATREVKSKPKSIWQAVCHWNGSRPNFNQPTLFIHAGDKLQLWDRSDPLWWKAVHMGSHANSTPQYIPSHIFISPELFERWTLGNEIYHGLLTSQLLYQENLLSGLKDGMFLMRQALKSEGEDSDFVLTVKKRHQGGFLKHYPISMNTQGYYQLQHIPPRPDDAQKLQFMSLTSLLHHYYYQDAGEDMELGLFLTDAIPINLTAIYVYKGESDRYWPERLS